MLDTKDFNVLHLDFMIRLYWIVNAYNFWAPSKGNMIRPCISLFILILCTMSYKNLIPHKVYGLDNSNYLDLHFPALCGQVLCSVFLKKKLGFYSLLYTRTRVGDFCFQKFSCLQKFSFCLSWDRTRIYH